MQRVVTVASPYRRYGYRRVTALLRGAGWRALLTAGEVSNQAAIARREGITRARVVQILGLLRHAPAIQHHILSMPRTVGCPTFSERVLRAITMAEDQGRSQRVRKWLVVQRLAIVMAEGA